MEAYAVSEDFRNHFKSAISSHFKLKVNFFKTTKHYIVLEQSPCRLACNPGPTTLFTLVLIRVYLFITYY